jgi:hypothetical protein
MWDISGHFGAFSGSTALLLSPLLTRAATPPGEWDYLGHCAIRDSLAEADGYPPRGTGTYWGICRPSHPAADCSRYRSYSQKKER